MSVSGLRHSVISGFFAALSGLFGKITFDQEILNSISSFFQLKPLFVQIGLGSALILSNLLMLQSFNLALKNSETTLQASLVNTAFNFVFTALIGSVVFAENLSLFWWTGTTFIIIGIYIINQDKSMKSE